MSLVEKFLDFFSFYLPIIRIIFLFVNTLSLTFSSYFYGSLFSWGYPETNYYSVDCLKSRNWRNFRYTLKDFPTFPTFASL